MPKEYRVVLRVYDDGKSNDGAFEDEYISQKDIIQEIERVDTAGLRVCTDSFKEVIPKKKKKEK